MKRLKLFIYPSAKTPEQDKVPCYRNTVPFCSAGIQQWVDMAGTPKSADYLMVGTITEFDPNPYDRTPFWKLNECPERHIVEFEGDYRRGTFREEFPGTVRIANGAPHEWRTDSLVFPRLPPCRLLVELAKATVYCLPADNSSFGFVGKLDRSKIRSKVVNAITGAGLKGNLSLLDVWNGPSEPNNPCRTTFTENMTSNGIAVCPQGEGVATARFYEACCFGRFPVVVGKTMLLGEDRFDTSFCYQMDETLSAQEMAGYFVTISNMPLSEIQERGRAARAYWDEIVVPYFKDPTLFFLEWMERRGLLR